MSYKLQAVNRCLKAIGESRVNSLNSGVPDAEDAATVVDETTVEVLQAGWQCNSAFNVKMVPSVEKWIAVPSNVLRIDTAGISESINVTVAVDPNDDVKKLFNVDTQSFEFDAPVYVDIVYSYPIDNLPFALQNYISAKAARKFQAGSLASVALDAMTTREEQEAWVMLVDAEAEAEDSNVLRDSPSVRRIVTRNDGYSW